MKTTYNRILFAFCFLNFVFAKAQNNVLINKLEQQLKTANYDSTKIRLMNALSWEWSEYDFKKAEDYARTSLQLSIQNNDKRAQMKSYNRLANALDYAARYDSVLIYYRKSLDICKELNDKDEEGAILNNIGASYYYQGKFNEALSNYVQAAAIREQIGDTTGYANCLNNIGIVYRNTGDFKNAVYTYRKSIAIKKTMNDTKGICNGYINLVVAFHELDEYDSAFAYADKALALTKQINEQSYLATVLAIKAPLYRDLKQYDKAISLQKEALRLTEQSDNLHERVRMISVLADIYELNKDYKNALEQHQKALEIAQPMQQNQVMLRSLSSMADIYAKQRNFEKAFVYQQQYLNLKDTVAQTENNEHLNELKTKFETELKDKEIKQTQAEQQLTLLQLDEKDRDLKFSIGLVVLSLLLAGVLFFFFLQKNKANQKIEEQRQKIEVALSEKEALLREIHHRVKNNLQVISGLLELQDARNDNPDTKKLVDEAQNRIKSMSITHEMLYQTSDLAAINVEEYVSRLVQSVESSFASQVHVKKEFQLSGVYFNIDTIIPLGLILNELLTNSYKYAFFSGRDNQLALSIQRKGASWEMIYGDNGNGLPAEITNIGSQKSFGLRLINMLVRQLKGKTEYWFNNGAYFIISFQEK